MEEQQEEEEEEEENKAPLLRQPAGIIGEIEEEENKAPDQRVLSLVTLMYSSGHVEYGEEAVPPLPLLLDQVSEGHLPRSEAPLLRLPVGILGEIVRCLEWSSLASFAFVNKDCWQLARSRRFASVLFDWSDSCIALLNKLQSEGFQRLWVPEGSFSEPSIGACIQRITVATNSRWVSKHRRASRSQGMATSQAMTSLSSSFFDGYLPILMSILSRRDILPHLELIDWRDEILLPPMFFKNLACSAVKHLKVFRAFVDDDCTVNLPGKWPLQTLHLEVKRNRFGKRKTGSTAVVCASVLRQCAPTLVSLTWVDESDGGVQSFVADSEDEVLFPCLRELRLGDIEFADSASLDALLGGNLVTLGADTETSTIHKQCFQTRGTIPSLETFVWKTYVIPADHALEFLAANSQLSMLSIQNAAPPVLLETKLLPLLSSSFKNLRSLSLVWEADAIRDSALRIIGTLTTLEQIHLSAGNQRGWKYDWLIDHKAMRTCLSSLLHLQKVAFSRDTYYDGLESGDVSRDSLDASDYVRYYEENDFLDKKSVVLEDGEDLDDDESRGAIWERLHRERMLCEAAQYVDALPELEWLYFGQIPMSVKPTKAPRGARNAVPLCAQRDSCWILLRKMFDAL